ncbi:MAG: preprotein translocase subunit YajC [Deltaproteobacteria bacterium]|nr:preprotein translocase subunit YajC [Deltaproteobacteria bacterium]
MTYALLGMAGNPQGGAGGAPQANMITSLVMPFALMFGIIYFLMIRPQKKQQKKLQEMLSTMHKGDQVVTRAGIYGKVAGIADNIVTVEIADNVRVKMSREAIVNVTSSTQVQAQ